MSWTITRFLLLLALMMPPLADAACTGASPTWTCTADYTSISNLLVSNIPGTLNDGDVVNVSAGTETWGTAFTIQSNKHFSLIGAGIGSTVITFSGDGGFTWVTEAGLSRISGFTFKTQTDGCSTYDGISSSIKIRGVSADVRIDNNRFETSLCASLHITNQVIGVIDHNEFDNATNSGHPLIIEHNTWGGVGSEGDNSWAQDPTYLTSTSQNLFVEDNTFTNSVANAANLNGVYMTDDFKGARTVYRFNTFTDSFLSTHGTESGGRIRGFRHVQAYRNKFDYVTPATTESLLGLRGGTGMLFDNYMVQNRANQMFTGNTYRRYFNVTGIGYYVWGGCGAQTTISSITRSGTTATATTTSEHFIHSSNSWVTITGGTSPFNGTFIADRVSSTQFTYTVANTGDTTSGGTPVKSSPFDGNTDSTGYPCLDQLGRGKGQYYSGYEPNVITPVAPANQALEPVYTWHNLRVATVNNFNPTGTTDIFVENRDYYNHNASYNGTTQRGVGYGTRASRPATCTTGDAWWSTDQGAWNTSTTETHSADVGLSAGADGVLDLCSATNTWTNDWYVPYTYPHPLISGEESPPARSFVPGLLFRR